MAKSLRSSVAALGCTTALLVLASVVPAHSQTATTPDGRCFLYDSAGRLTVVQSLLNPSGRAFALDLGSNRKNIGTFSPSANCPTPLVPAPGASAGGASLIAVRVEETQIGASPPITAPPQPGAPSGRSASGVPTTAPEAGEVFVPRKVQPRTPR